MWPAGSGLHSLIRLWSPGQNPGGRNRSNFEHDIFGKLVNRFCCKLAQLVHGARGWNDQVSGSWSKIKVTRFGDLSEALCSTPPVEYVSSLPIMHIIRTIFCRWLTEIHCVTGMSNTVIPSDDSDWPNAYRFSIRKEIFAHLLSTAYIACSVSYYFQLNWGSA